MRHHISSLYNAFEIIRAVFEALARKISKPLFQTGGSFSSKTWVEVTEKLLWFILYHFQIIQRNLDYPTTWSLNHIILSLSPHPTEFLLLNLSLRVMLSFFLRVSKNNLQRSTAATTTKVWLRTYPGAPLWRKRMTFLSQLSDRENAFLEELMIFAPLWTMRMRILELVTDFILLHECPYIVVNYFSP